MLNHRKQIPTLLLALFMTVQASSVQAQAYTGNQTKAEKRLAIIAKKYASCDDFSAEGLRFKCLEETLLAYENDITRLNAELRSDLCPEMVKTFDSTAQAWSSYYQAEKKHIGHLNDCQGTHRLYVNYSALVQLLASRCSYLSSQLGDYKR
jgi:hypothetical protein